MKLPDALQCYTVLSSQRRVARHPNPAHAAELHACLVVSACERPRAAPGAPHAARLPLRRHGPPRPPRRLAAANLRVRTAQFNTILNEPPVIVFQMRVNTCMPESVPRVTSHLETRITDTLFA